LQGLCKAVGPYFLALDTFQDFLSFLGVFPEVGLQGDAFFFLYFSFFSVVVKDTSSRPLFWPLNLSVDR
jgi:hypothetical protein